MNGKRFIADVAVIAMIDGGVDSSLPDLIDNRAPGYDFCEGDAVADPAHDVEGD